MHTPFARKIVSNPSTCLFSCGSCMNENVVFIDNIFHPFCSHFVGSSSPTHSLFNQKKSFFGKRQITWHYVSRACSICRERTTLLPHGSVIVMWSISVSSFIFPWAHNGPDISIYRTGADGVSSCNKSDEYLLARFPVLIWSFSNVLSLLKSSYFFFERRRRHICYSGERIYNPHFNFSSETGTCSMIRLADSYKNPTEELKL